MSICSLDSLVQFTNCMTDNVDPDQMASEEAEAI